MITSTSLCLTKLFQKVPRKQERLKQPALVIRKKNFIVLIFTIVCIINI